MIIYGTKGTHLKSDKVSGLMCKHCNEQRTHTISVFGKYFYIYWIPLFPIGKKGVSECNHCKATYESKEMSEQLKLALDNVKRNTKTPITHWIGLLLIGGLFAVFMIFGGKWSEERKQKKATYINSPMVGDIIDYESSDKAYSTLKITKVTTDSVFVVANTMEIAKKRKLYKIDKEENYNAERYGLSLKEYQDSFKTKRFLDVDRD